jgi:acetylornithine/N-succinyldiaminopimelate aminotransferase
VIESQVRLAARLAELLPPHLGRVYFTNSGAEAIEGAMKAARKFTGRSGFAAFEGAYHGDTTGALALAGNPAFRAPFEPLLEHVRHLPFGDAGALGAIDSSVAAVVIEPVQAEAGVRIPTVEFMGALRAQCDRAGALLIFDEVLTGFGRTGRMFAFEHFGVTPDIIVMAKALGGGLPLGAFAGSDQLIGGLSHDPPLGHITTFGGHPLSCAAGLAAVDAIERERLAARADDLGGHLRERLRSLSSGAIANVRGIGLLAGVEFRTARAAQRFVAGALERGVIVNWTLNADTVVRLAPPLTISHEELEFAVAAMRATLGALG